MGFEDGDTIPREKGRKKGARPKRDTPIVIREPKATKGGYRPRVIVIEEKPMKKGTVPSENDNLSQKQERAARREVNEAMCEAAVDNVDTGNPRTDKMIKERLEERSKRPYGLAMDLTKQAHEVLDPKDVNSVKRWTKKGTRSDLDGIDTAGMDVQGPPYPEINAEGRKEREKENEEMT